MREQLYNTKIFTTEDNSSKISPKQRIVYHKITELEMNLYISMHTITDQFTSCKFSQMIIVPTEPIILPLGNLL